MTVQELVEELSGVIIGGGGDLPVLAHPESSEADSVAPEVDHLLQEWPKDRMSYHCGICERIARMTGKEPCEPHIVCDGCGKKRSVYRSPRYGVPAQWFLDGKPPPFWKGWKNRDGTRSDYCPDCKREKP